MCCSMAAHDSENAIASYIVTEWVMTDVVRITLYIYAVNLVGLLTGGVFIAEVGATAYHGRCAPTYL